MKYVYLFVGFGFGIIFTFVCWQQLKIRSIPEKYPLPTIVITNTLTPTNTETPTILPTKIPSTTLQEGSSINASNNPEWWLSSGGKVFFQNGTIRTIHGALPATDHWYQLYKNSNPKDTDDGAHPQNIFRLVNKKTLKNYSQEVYFSVNAFNNSNSENRNESNGILLFNHYLDENNLYYTGLRVDGQAVIKKKLGGSYTTLAIKKIISGNYTIEPPSNLLTIHKLYGIKSVVHTSSDNVEISLFVDLDNSGKWKETLHVDDKIDNDHYTLKQPGHLGIRSDFMDVEFSKYKINELSD